MGWESSDVFRFDLGPLLQGQTRIAKLKSAYNLLIIGPRGLESETNLEKIMGCESSDSNSNWTLKPLNLPYSRGLYGTTKTKQSTNFSVQGHKKCQVPQRMPGGE